MAWVAINWAAQVPVRVLMLENVEEFVTWGPVVDGRPCSERRGETFDGFIKALSTGLPAQHPAMKDIYQALFRTSFDIKRKLSIYKAIRRGLGYQIEWRLLSACDYGAPTTRKRLFLIARNDGKPIIWRKPTHGSGKGLKPFRTAADIIDWSLPVRSIFNRKRPLAEKTMQRIAKGIEKFVLNDEPFVVPEAAAIPFITECANASSQRNMAADEPLRTICAQVKGGHFALVTSHIMKMRGTNVGHRTDSPLHTISAGGFHHAEVRAFMLKYYGTNYGHALNEPLQTVTTKHRFALVTIKGERYQIVDIGLRMLEPHELFAAQAFPETYQITYDSKGNRWPKYKQVARCGNAVCPNMAEMLVADNFSSVPDDIAA